MRDVVYLLIVLAFFALCVGYVSLCDRIIGPDPDLPPSGDDETTPDRVLEVLP